MNQATDTSSNYTDKNRLSRSKVAEMAVIGVLLVFVNAYFGTFSHLWTDWNSASIDRTYTMFIPLFAAIFVWLKWRKLVTIPIESTFWGLPLVLFGIATRMLAEPGQVNFVKYASLIFMLAGAVWMVVGNKMFKELLFPVAFLIFMVPMPDFLYQRMSVPMMDFAAKAGFGVTKLLGVDAMLTGRQITILAAGALQKDLPYSVVEACSGMKSLFTLGAVAVGFAYITRRDFATRLIISLSAIPIAIIMNMLRVALVGVLAVKIGEKAVDETVHDTQGIINYILEIALLFGVGALISWIFGKPTVEWGRADAPADEGKKSFPYSTRISAPAIVCIALLVVSFPALFYLHDRVKHLSEGVDTKRPLSEFTTTQRDPYPSALESAYFRTLGIDELSGMDADLSSGDIQYVGFPEAITNAELKGAELDQYLNIRYFECPKRTTDARDVEKMGENVLAYVAFHRSASDGVNRSAIHYPDQCYPGQGMATAATGNIKVHTPGYCGGETEMARSVFYDENGNWILVYYHMNNNGRGVMDRSLGKMDNFIKLILGQRSGFMAQVQLFTVVGRGEPRPGGISDEKIKAADGRLQRFAPVFLLKLGGYLPDPVK